VIETNTLATDAGTMVYTRRPPASKDDFEFLLLHGLSGDERAMWILESALPEGSGILAPRAIYSHEPGGYSWLPAEATYPPTQAEFEPAIQALNQLLEGLQRQDDWSPQRSIWMGFSQGSALMFAFAAQHAQGIAPRGLAALAAFLPQGEFEALQPFPVYWGHGVQDKTIPIEQARQDIQRLQKAAVQVEVCEADVGHKVGVECLRGLKRWLQALEARH
jgi:predicted esterase